jgi:hypothetical protein
MTLLGKQIQLKGLSQKGKNRIRENGDRWVVLAETDRVLFAPNQIGPFLFIATIGCDQNHRASRWIRAEGDLDFSVIRLD